MIPLLVARLIAKGEGDEMSDIQYLAIKEFKTKRVDVDGTLSLNNNSVETDLATQTASAGKDMYLGEASISGRVTNEAGGNIGTVTYRLFANAVEIDKFVIEDPRKDSSSGQRYGNWEHTFLTKSVKVIATQVIKITAQNQAAGINRTTIQQGKLLLWEENTGATPQEPPLNPV